jgi:hypothetical protein
MVLPFHPKGVLLERSLSILLPVRDDQSALAAKVQRLLDALAEQPGQFELIVIDDGSTDATIEVADELARQYPQVSAVRHARPLGQDAAIQTGLQLASGDLVLVHDRGGMRRIDRESTLSGPRAHAKPDVRANRPNSARRRPSRPSYLTRPENRTFGE